MLNHSSPVVKIKPPGIGAQILVHVSSQGNPFWGYPIFDHHSHVGDLERDAWPVVSFVEMGEVFQALEVFFRLPPEVVEVGQRAGSHRHLQRQQYAGEPSLGSQPSAEAFFFFFLTKLFRVEPWWFFRHWPCFFSHFFGFSRFHPHKSTCGGVSEGGPVSLKSHIVRSLCCTCCFSWHVKLFVCWCAFGIRRMWHKEVALSSNSVDPHHCFGSN